MKEEYFWSIVIEQELVQAGLWTIRGENVAIVSTSEAQKWETDEDLVTKIDEALSSVINEFPEDAKEPSKTVFGVPASWVEDGKIRRPHLEKIRLVCSKLSLTPTSFVVLPEAIAHSVKVKEGSPLSGIVIGVGTGSLDLTLFRLGNIVGTVSVGRSTSLVEDVIEGLNRFSAGENVPTRWLLYDGKEVDLEDIKQALIKTDWGDYENVKMLHTPQIEIVTVKEKAEAVSIAGASEIGEIKGIDGLTKPGEEHHDNLSETADLTAEDLGFVVDQNVEEPNYAIAELQETEKESHKKSIFSKLALLSVIKNLTQKKKKQEDNPVHTHSVEPAHYSPKVSGSKRKRILFIIGFLLLLLALGGIYAAIYFPKAEVTIFISPKNLQEAQTIILDENAVEADIDNLTFPAESVEVEVTSESNKSATGTKTVGDKAKGKVTIRNGTAAEVSFDAGTKLVSSGNLVFAIDESVTVPEAESPTTPGSVSVNATAGDIGAEYNLAKDESFKVGNYPKSEIDALTEEEFSGGSSREIVAIAESDRKSLKDELTDEINAIADRQLEEKATNARFVSGATRYEIVEENFSGAAGEEADSVSLTMTVKAIGLVIPEAQIKELSDIILKDQVPQGFSLRTEQVISDFTLVDEVDDGVWEFDINLSANLLPSIDVETLRKEIAGKSPQNVEVQLAKIPGYSKAVVVVKPKLPGILGNIPRIEKNISVEIVAEQ